MVLNNAMQLKQVTNVITPTVWARYNSWIFSSLLQRVKNNHGGRRTINKINNMTMTTATTNNNKSDNANGIAEITITKNNATDNSDNDLSTRKMSLLSSSLSSSTLNLEKIKATKLVDELLESTRLLMQEEQKVHVIAYSGGVDSSLATALVHHNSIDNSDIIVKAVLGLSPAVPQDQVQLAQQVADVIGVDFETIATTEGTDDVYILNAGQACLACKTHLYTCLQAIVAHYDKQMISFSSSSSSSSSSSFFQLYNGTNKDDLSDPTRLGLVAARNFNVASPIQGISKDQVRIAAKHLGLPNWNYASSPCLRSRLAIGVSAIPQHLQRIEQAEQFIKEQLSLGKHVNLRVRLLTKNRSMIEIDIDYVQTIQEQYLSLWESYFVDTLKFASVNVRPFQSGSVAPKVAVATTKNDSNNNDIIITTMSLPSGQDAINELSTTTTTTSQNTEQAIVAV